MSRAADLAAPNAPPPPQGSVHRDLTEALVAAVAAGRPLTRVEGSDLPELPPDTALAWLDAPATDAPDTLLEGIVAAAAEGVPVLVALRRPAPGRDDDGTAEVHREPGETFSRLLERLPEASVIEERRSAVTFLRDPGRETVTLSAEAGAIAGWFVISGAAPGALDAICAQAHPSTILPTEVQLRALERANEELRRANTRLAREHLGRSDSAAASIIHQRDEARRLLAIEQQVARDNDRYFQDARRQLQRPHHRAADKLARLIRELPLVGAAARFFARRLF